METSTIAAISTPGGHGGIGIIRLSGPKSLNIAVSMFRHPSGRAPRPDELKSHQLYFGHIVDDAAGVTLDEVLLATMRAPRSYTREDVVEIQAHSGRAVLRGILDLALKHGAALAAPGEFTKRAYLNGRIDLTQAEAVIDIVRAATAASLTIAAAQIKGEIGQVISGLRRQLILMLAEIEAAIDFGDEIEAQDLSWSELAQTLATTVILPIQDLIRRHDRLGFVREGLKVAIVGKPNVGKSSLMNALINRDRAIVTDIPGTTRDLIEEPLDIQGLPVILADTAGLRETDHPVEIIGIEKTAAYIREADVVLLVVDASRPITAEDQRIYEIIGSTPHVLIGNKADLIPDDQAVSLPESWRNSSFGLISALSRQGMDQLFALIKTTVMSEALDHQHGIVPNLRHRRALERCLASVMAVSAGLMAPETPVALLAVDIREAIEALAEITGESLGDAVLDTIFDKFCIGK